jgi:hypothetical protein
VDEGVREVEWGGGIGEGGGRGDESERWREGWETYEQWPH